MPGQGVPNAMSVPGYALVRDDREMKIKQGRSQLSFTDVAALIDPTTVTFTSLTDPSTRVLEQNFQFDLVSTQKLLLKFIDRQITVDKPNGNSVTPITGTLLSATDGIVLRGNDGSIYSLPSYSSVRFPDLPGGLNTRPTLVWDIQSPVGGSHKARVTYQTGGITWWADYNLIFNEGADANSGLLDLSAWVSIINQSGATYPDAKLKLIAGDVHRAAARRWTEVARTRGAGDGRSRTGKPNGFEQKDFFEFHLYTLGRKTTLPNNSTKQIELFDQAKQIPAKKMLLYYGAVQPYFYPSPYTDRNLGIEMNKKVDVYLEFKNDKQFGLGVPLPAGRMRVSQARRGRRQPRVHRRGQDRSHAEGRAGAREARFRVRRGRRTPPGRLRRRHHREVDGRRNRSEAAQPQVAARRGGREGKPLPLEQLEDPHQDAQLREGRRAHHQLPGEGGEGRRDGRALPGALHLVARWVPGRETGITHAWIIPVCRPGPLRHHRQPNRSRAEPCKPWRFRRIQARIVASTSAHRAARS